MVNNSIINLRLPERSCRTTRSVTNKLRTLEKATLLEENSKTIELVNKRTNVPQVQTAISAKNKSSKAASKKTNKQLAASNDLLSSDDI
jgi:predicted metal-dependent hydrolase